MRRSKGVYALFALMIVIGAALTVVNHRRNQKKLGLILTSNAMSVDVHEVKRLLEQGADPNSALNGSGTALWGAATKNNAEMMRLLLDNGADINYRDRKGATVLHFAAEYCSPGLVKLLLQRGADPNIRTDQGKSALDVAQTTRRVRQRHPGENSTVAQEDEIISLLRRAGAK